MKNDFTVDVSKRNKRDFLKRISIPLGDCAASHGHGNGRRCSVCVQGIVWILGDDGICLGSRVFALPDSGLHVCFFMEGPS